MNSIKTGDRVVAIAAPETNTDIIGRTGTVLERDVIHEMMQVFPVELDDKSGYEHMATLLFFTEELEVIW